MRPPGSCKAEPQCKPHSLHRPLCRRERGGGGAADEGSLSRLQAGAPQQGKQRSDFVPDCGSDMRLVAFIIDPDRTHLMPLRQVKFAIGPLDFLCCDCGGSIRDLSEKDEVLPMSLRFRSSESSPRTLLCAAIAVALLGACTRQPATTDSAGPGANASSRGTQQTLPDWSGAWALSDESFLKGAFPDTGYAGFGDDGGRVPLHPKYKAVRDQSGRRSQMVAAAGNLPKCLPGGMPGIMQHPLMFEFLFTPGRVTLLFEDGEVRRIWTDGRSHPAPEDTQESFSGHSIGHWEGETLVVDTVGISPRADLLLGNDLRATRNTHLIERMALENKDTLRVETEVQDEELFTGPYKYTRTYVRSPLPMTDSNCTANNRDNDQKDIDLTPPPPY